MMLYTVYLAIRHSFELTQRAEVEDAAEVIFTLQPRHIGIRGIMQVRRTQQTMRTYRASTGSHNTA